MPSALSDQSFSGELAFLLALKKQEAEAACSMTASGCMPIWKFLKEQAQVHAQKLTARHRSRSRDRSTHERGRAPLAHHEPRGARQNRYPMAQALPGIARTPLLESPRAGERSGAVADVAEHPPVCATCAGPTWQKCSGCRTTFLCAGCQADDRLGGREGCSMCRLIDTRGWRRVYGRSSWTPATSS